MIALATIFSLPASLSAQDSSGPATQVRSPVLLIDSERLYLDSLFGQRIASETETASSILAAENRSIEAELTEEERALTEQRPTLDPETFRDLADAFDRKVRAIRQAQDTKVRALRARQEESRGAFLAIAAPVLEAMMLEAGAAVMLEQRFVFLSLNAVDITREAVQRIDAEIGDGQTLVPSDPTLPVQP